MERYLDSRFGIGVALALALAGSLLLVLVTAASLFSGEWVQSAALAGVFGLQARGYWRVYSEGVDREPIKAV